MSATRSRVVGSAEAAFREAGLPGHSWFEALDGLARAPGGSLRMGELAAGTSLGAPGLTRLVDRMEAAGHVVRGRDESDRRAVIVGLTEEGLSLHARMALLHARAVARELAGRPGVSAERITEALAPLAAA